MSPALAVFVTWVLFGGSHLLLSSSALRTKLNDKLGATRFVVVYTLIAALTLLLLAATVAHYGGDGPSGFGLTIYPGMRWVLGAVAFIGASFTVTGLVGYSQSAIAALARRMRASEENRRKPLQPPTVIERITRHPFFLGVAMLMLAHTLLASTQAQALYFFGFVVLALLGIPMQDRKLRARHGEVYESFISETSNMPFATQRRSTADERKPVWPLILTMVASPIVLYLLHPFWKLGYGAPFAIVTVVGGLVAVARQLRRS